MHKDKSSPGLPDILDFITSIQGEKKKKLRKKESKKEIVLIEKEMKN